MKYIFGILILVSSAQTFAEDISDTLKKNRCTPHRGSDGTLTYKCDGPLGKKLKQGQIINSSNAVQVQPADVQEINQPLGL